MQPIHFDDDEKRDSEAESDDTIPARDSEDSEDLEDSDNDDSTLLNTPSPDPIPCPQPTPHPLSQQHPSFRMMDRPSSSSEDLIYLTREEQQGLFQQSVGLFRGPDINIPPSSWGGMPHTFGASASWGAPFPHSPVPDPLSFIHPRVSQPPSASLGAPAQIPPRAPAPSAALGVPPQIHPRMPPPVLQGPSQHTPGSKDGRKPARKRQALTENVSSHTKETFSTISRIVFP